MQLIGRKLESKLLQKAIRSNKPELIAIYGRRRVGKTFLIRNSYKSKIDFEITGIQNSTLKE